MPEPDKKRKVFISLPMRGLTDDEIKERIQSLYSHLSNGYELIDTFWTETPPNPNNHLWYLGKSIQALGEADLVVFAWDWSVAPGCQVEMAACEAYGIPYVGEVDLLKAASLRENKLD
jgi:hypothetical protein